MNRGQAMTLATAILGTAVVTIDSSVVSVALPAIQRDLGGGLSTQQWVSNAYLLTLSSLILIGGSLGDIYGERRVFAVGIAAFGVISIACALAPTTGVLIAARALQGAAGALVTPASLAILVAAFGPKERGTAIGTWTAWGALAGIFGSLAGGFVIDRFSGDGSSRSTCRLSRSRCSWCLRPSPQARASSIGRSTSPAPRCAPSDWAESCSASSRSRTTAGPARRSSCRSSAASPSSSGSSPTSGARPSPCCGSTCSAVATSPWPTWRH